MCMYYYTVYGFFSDSVGCVDKDECERYCENPLGCTDIAYPKLVLEILPTGKP